MRDNRNHGRFAQTAIDMRNYAGLWADNVRLSLIDNLSSLLSTLFGVLILIVLLGIAAMFFAVGVTWILGLLLGSFLWAIFIMGAFFVVLALVIYSMRKRLVINQTIQMMSHMVYDISKKYSDDEEG